IRFKKRKSLHDRDNEKSNLEELRVLIKEQTETIIESIKDQQIRATEIQQKQHTKQMDIFRQFLMKF
ncbi:12636_t:CDS:1, partial [Cetraspora pellucida]